MDKSTLKKISWLKDGISTPVLNAIRANNGSFKKIKEVLQQGCCVPGPVSKELTRALKQVVEASASWDHTLNVAAGMLQQYYKYLRTVDHGAFIVWWLSQKDCETLAAVFPSQFRSLSPYLKETAENRFGRPGWGRLWIPEEILIIEINWDNQKPATQYAKDCGGVVCWKKDLPAICGLPGIITDTDMNLLQP